MARIKNAYGLITVINAFCIAGYQQVSGLQQTTNLALRYGGGGGGGVGGHYVRGGGGGGKKVKKKA